MENKEVEKLTPGKVSKKLNGGGEGGFRSKLRMKKLEVIGKTILITDADKNFSGGIAKTTKPPHPQMAPVVRMKADGWIKKDYLHEEALDKMNTNILQKTSDQSRD